MSLVVVDVPVPALLIPAAASQELGLVPINQRTKATTEGQSSRKSAVEQYEPDFPESFAVATQPSFTNNRCAFALVLITPFNCTRPDLETLHHRRQLTAHSKALTSRSFDRSYLPRARTFPELLIYFLLLMRLCRLQLIKSYIPQKSSIILMQQTPA